MKRSKGFTLVELLVVISIIALLLSILLPSLRLAREQAKKVICLSNFRQAGISMGTYQVDNDGYTFTYYLEEGTGYCVQWWSALVWGNYLQDNSIIHCPSFRGKMLPYWEDIYSRSEITPSMALTRKHLQLGIPSNDVPGPYTAYGYQGSVGNIIVYPANLLSYPNRNDAKPFKLLRFIKHPGNEIMLLDTAHATTSGPDGMHYTLEQWKNNIGAKRYSDPVDVIQSGNAWMQTNSWGNGYTYGFSVRHGFATNTLFFDGHVETRDGEALWNQDWDNGANPLDGF